MTIGKLGHRNGRAEPRLKLSAARTSVPPRPSGTVEQRPELASAPLTAASIRRGKLWDVRSSPDPDGRAGYTSSASSIADGELTRGVPSTASGYSKIFPSKFR